MRAPGDDALSISSSAVRSLFRGLQGVLTHIVSPVLTRLEAGQHK